MWFNFGNPISKALFGAACCAILAACGGGGSGSVNPPYGGGGSCVPGTDVQIANPTPQSQGVPTNIGSITIVANGNSNQLYSTYSNWSLILQGNFGPITGGNLALVPRNGPQPFPSDFYYSASVPSLPGGENFQVQIVNNNGYCSPVTVGEFST
ncbi:MAG TPA: hypothetical protein VGN11_12945 [Candidatus Baltobacteraceae bacterium]|jgi:hypothetical protein|nr:hypothetical protein [Candidatus Baltobacteraceae bacterium]